MHYAFFNALGSIGGVIGTNRGHHMPPAFAVLERISLPAVVTDDEDRIVFLNEAASAFGRLNEGDCFSADTFPTGVRRAKAPWGESDRFVTVMDREGENLIIEWSPSIIDEGQLYLGQDRSRERKHWAVLRQMARRAADASQAKMRFLATMSHEMRTPLNGILGMTGLMLESDLDSNQRTYGEAVRESGMALLGLINDILDYSKIEAGKLELEDHPFDPEALVQSITELLSPRAAGKNLEIASYIAPNVPRRLRGDEARLRQVLLNLAGNGVKFTEDGGVSIEVRRVEGGTDERPMIRFDVRDTGIGISEANLQRIFEEFAQADDTRARNHEGTGLGLTIAQQIVMAMGGQIVGESEVGDGSCFSFAVPLALNEQQQHGEVPKVTTNPQVVIAAANPFLRRMLRLQLEAAGVTRISESEDHACTDELLRRHPGSILLCDLPIAATDGATLVRHAGKAIVLLSPMARGRLEAFRRAGFDGYLIKPIRQLSLVERLTDVPIEDRRDRLDSRELQKTPSAQRKLRVLLAEDNQINAVLATAILKRAGHHVDVAGNGREAVETFALAPYDIVLMDMRMPEMDGIEATRQLRAQGHDAVPIIALTANAMSADREECLAAGMVDFLSKPFDPTDLISLLERWTAQPPAATTNGATAS